MLEGERIRAKIREDTVQIKVKAVSVPDVPAGIVKTQLRIEGLQEQIATVA